MLPGSSRDRVTAPCNSAGFPSSSKKVDGSVQLHRTITPHVLHCQPQVHSFSSRYSIAHVLKLCRNIRRRTRSAVVPEVASLCPPTAFARKFVRDKAIKNSGTFATARHKQREMSCDFPIAKAVEAEGESAPMFVGVVDECVSSTVSNPDACSGFLNKNGWPAGLQDAVTATIRRMPIR
jgi:hypothetical protein